MPWTGCLGVWWGRRRARCRGQDSRSSEAAKNREKSLGVADQAWVGKEGYTGLQTECPRVSLWWKGKLRALLKPSWLRYLHLMSVLHMRLAFSLDTTMQMTRMKMRKLTCRAYWQKARTVLLPPVISLAPGQVHQLPFQSPTLSLTPIAKRMGSRMMSQ